MPQLFFEDKEIIYLAHPIDTFHDGRRALSLCVSFSTAPVRVTFLSNVSRLMPTPLRILSSKSFAFTFVVTK
jgi:hypothetical protein